MSTHTTTTPAESMTEHYQEIINDGSLRTSRIIVKNLPKYATDEQVRKHFSIRGYSITDLKLAKTAEGKFRRFAFVGFSNEKEAQDCQAYFNHTYMDTSKLQVDLALPVGDSTLPRPWSRHSRGSSAYSSLHPEESEAARKKAAHESEQQRIRLETEKKRKFLFSIYGGEEAMDDPAQAAELGKFLSAMKTKSQTKTWENDTDVFSKQPNSTVVNVNVKSVKSKKTGGEGILIPKVHMKFEDETEPVTGYFEKSDDEDLYENFPGTKREEMKIELESEGAKPLNIKPSSSPSAKTETVLDSKYERLNPEMIAESGRLFVRNLSYSITEADLEGLFSQYGLLSQVHLPIAKDTKKPIGMAYILFMLPDDALKAYSALDGTIFQGRILHILPAKDQVTKEESSNNNSSNNNNSYKAKKEQELKAQSSSSHNWNSLFIRSDAVLDAVSARLGVPKSSIMNTHESDSLATRLAIAETHIIQETKEYLESEGVFLDAFINNAQVERSKTVILVKNLPFDVEGDELRSLFGKYGALDRVILPPLTRSIALIEFLEGNEAKSGFRALAYSKFHSAPLFLEWAPMNSLQARESKSVHVVRTSPLDSPTEAENDGQTTGTSKNTLYIKNLSFKTEVSSLKKLFAPIGPIRSARIPTKPSPSNTSVQLSLGFGFIEFADSEDVNRALDTLQGVQLDGHALILKKAAGGVASEAPGPNSSKKRNSSTSNNNAEVAEDEASKPCKLLIRNIPFESTESELRTLVKSFTAALKRLRLPKKFDGTHRGFGFAEFTSHAEAKHIKETMAATHLYGRHLVIEWAKVEVDEKMMENN